MSFGIHGNQTGSTGKYYTYKSRLTGQVTTYRAENGMIRIVCERNVAHSENVDGGLNVISIREFLLRARALNAECTRDLTPHYDELRDKRRLIEFMVGVAAQARQQGDPHEILFGDTPQNRKPPARVMVSGVPWAKQASHALPPIPSAPAGKMPVDIRNF